MADNARMYSASTTAAAPQTKPRTGHPQTERTAMEAEPPSSNAWNAMVPDAVPEQPRSVPMTKEDERHMREDLGRDPSQLLKAQLDNEQKLHDRRDQLNEAAPGQNIDEVAAADAVGIDPAAAAAAAPRPTAEQIDSNRLSEEQKFQPEPFVRRETGT